MLEQALLPSLGRAFVAQHQRLSRSADALGLLDPSLVLRRGYAWLTDEKGVALTRVQQVSQGQPVTATLADGRLRMTVDERLPGP